MANIADRIIEQLRLGTPLDDDALAKRLGVSPRQTINQVARRLQKQGALVRYDGPDGKIVNALPQSNRVMPATCPSPGHRSGPESARPNSAAYDTALPVGAETMTLSGVEFWLVGPIEGDRDSGGDLVLSEPHTRFANPRGLELHAYGRGPFARLRLNRLPDLPGVYAVVSANGGLRYIGRARDSVKKRWGPTGYAVIHPRNCFQGGQNTNCRLNRLITDQLEQDTYLSLWVHLTPDPTRVESMLIAGLQPPWNRTGRFT